MGSAIPGETPDKTKSLIAEFLFTFALVYIILNVMFAKGESSSSFYRFAIGFMLMTCTFSVGGMADGAFNAEIAIDAPLMSLMSWCSIWIHLVADLMGGMLAVVVFTLLNQYGK